jgi:hypothetical protein
MFSVFSESGRGPRGSARELADNQANRQTPSEPAPFPTDSQGWVSTVMRRGKGLLPFPHTPFIACASLPPLRSGQVFRDEAKHLFHNRGASVAALRGLFAFGPECRSRSLRNHRSPSPESSLKETAHLQEALSPV